MAKITTTTTTKEADDSRSLPYAYKQTKHHHAPRRPPSHGQSPDGGAGALPLLRPECHRPVPRQRAVHRPERHAELPRRRVVRGGNPGTGGVRPRPSLVHDDVACGRVEYRQDLRWDLDGGSVISVGGGGRVAGVRVREVYKGCRSIYSPRNNVHVFNQIHENRQYTAEQ